MKPVLYITHDGVTDHIGRSQVAPYLMGLAEAGHSIHVLSAEKPGREALKDLYKRLFAERGIRWTFVTYHNRPPLASTLFDLSLMYRKAAAIVRAEGTGIVHCRSHLPMLIGTRLKARFGCKLLFDFRHFWVENGIITKKYKFVYRWIGKLQKRFFRASDGVVCLTERAVDILDGWYPSREGRARFQVIPCCADFDHFDPSKVTDAEVRRLRDKVGLAEGDFVLLYLGSLGIDYLLAEMMKLFVELRALRPGAKFLFVANNGREEVEAARAALNIPAEAIRFVSGTREEIPACLKLTDLSVFFIRADLPHAGCSPTKLAELFAAGVPAIGNANVGDLDQILDVERNCSVAVPDFEPETLLDSLRQVIEAAPERRSAIREASREFALEEGVRRYAAVYARLNATAEQAEPVSAQSSHPKRPARSC